MGEVGVTVRRGAPGETDADTRVVGLFEGGKLDEPELQALVDSGEAKGGLKKVAVAHEDGTLQPDRLLQRPRTNNGCADRAAQPLFASGPRVSRGSSRAA